MPGNRESGASAPSLSLTLDITPEMMTTLEQLSRDSQQPLESVFTRALSLYREALRAAAQGNHIGYAASSDSLDVEFTGLAGSGGR